MQFCGRYQSSRPLDDGERYAAFAFGDVAPTAARVGGAWPAVATKNSFKRASLATPDLVDDDKVSGVPHTKSSARRAEEGTLFM